jgi:hypothetical protein
MKKRNFLNKNLYKILFVRPDGKRALIDFTDSGKPIRERLIPESRMRRAIRTDLDRIEINPEIQKSLALRIVKRKSDTILTRNSFFSFLFPIFSLKDIELKMAFISLAVVITLAVGPASRHSVDRNFNPYFLADTLRDSSMLNVPLVIDSATKVE